MRADAVLSSGGYVRKKRVQNNSYLDIPNYPKCDNS